MSVPNPIYNLTLHKTYYEKGLFNLGVSVNRYVRPTSGPIKITLGRTNQIIEGQVNRDANPNGTPRVSGGNELRDWFINNYSLKDQVNIEILSPTEIHIG